MPACMHTCHLMRNLTFPLEGNKSNQVGNAWSEVVIEGRVVYFSWMRYIPSAILLLMVLVIYLFLKFGTEGCVSLGMRQPVLINDLLYFTVKTCSISNSSSFFSSICDMRNTTASVISGNSGKEAR